MMRARTRLAALAVMFVVLAISVVWMRWPDEAASSRADSALEVAASDDPGSMPPGAQGRAPAGSAARSGGQPTGCTGILDEATAFLLAERSGGAESGTEAIDEAALLAELARLRSDISGVRDPELFLTQFLVGSRIDWPAAAPEDQAQLRQLGEIAAESGSSLLAWHALRSCTEAGTDCPILNLEERLLAADRQNAEAWALVATMRYRRGDMDGALAAMRGAASAPTSTWYWTETITALERGLSERTLMAYPDRIATVFGAAAAAALPSQQHLLTMCGSGSAADREWAQICLAFGELRSERNETELARAIANAIRERALRSLGDQEGADRLRQERDWLPARPDDPAFAERMSLERLRTALIEAAPSRLQAYLSHVQQFGEREGSRVMLRQELPPVLERAGLQHRPAVQACVARLLAPA